MKNHKRKDLVTVGVAISVVAVIGALVIAAVLDAQRSGRSRLNELQVGQVEQLARGMDARTQQVFESFQGLTAVPYNLTRNDPADTERLGQLAALIPESKTGIILVNAKGKIVNGILLRDADSIGQTIERPGLDEVLQGKPAFLPVAPGLTTALPTVALAYPLKNATGQLNGAFLFESEVAATSQFNEEVAQLAGKDNAQFSFIDGEGVVVASNNTESIGLPLDLALPADSGIVRMGGDVVVVKPVPSAGWRAVFRQPTADFEGSLTSPLRSAMVYLALLTLLMAGLVGIVLMRRLARSREEQRRLHQLSAEREEFISIVSHELRTPVSGLLGFLQTSLDHWDQMDDVGRRRAVARAWANASRLYAMSRDVLDSSSVESGHLSYARELFDMRDVLSAAVTAAQELAPGNPIMLEAGDAPLWVDGDPERLQQVIGNLLDNATKASPPDGPIVVSAEQSGMRAVVTVQDSGPGLSPDDLERAFEKFVRGRGSRTVGTGLGLFICKKIVEAHGGQITAANAATGGAQFRIELATASAPAEPIGA